MSSPRPQVFTYPSSRADSFKTAREEQWSSDAGDSRIHLPLDDTPTLGYMDSSRLRGTDERGLGLAFENQDGDETPTARNPYQGTDLRKLSEDIKEYDGEDYNVDEIPNREWDTNLMRNVTVRRKRQPKSPPKQKTLDSLDTASSGTGSTVRQASSLRERVDASKSSPRTPSIEKFARDIGWPNEVNSILNSHMRDVDDTRRLSGMSATSTVVEAVVVITPPQRKRTLRHTGRNIALRLDGDSSTDRSPVTRSNRTSLNSDDLPLHRLVHQRARIPERKHRNSGDSELSTADTSSLRTSTPRHNQEIIPVAVYPQSRVAGGLQPSAEIKSNEPTRSHSLSRNPRRDINTHKRMFSAPEAIRDIGVVKPTPLVASETIPQNSRRDVESAPSSATRTAPRIETTSPSTNGVASQDASPTSPKLRRTKRVPDSPLSPLNTFKELPPIPVTPRLEDTKCQRSAHEAKQLECKEQPQRTPSSEKIPTIKEPQPPVRARSHRSSISQDGHSRLSLDRIPAEELLRHSVDGSLHPDDHRRISFDRSTVRTEEHAMARHLYAQSTPFSQFSDTPDALEVSEATAVSIYPHNNHSLLVVQQVARSNTLPNTQPQIAHDTSNPHSSLPYLEAQHPEPLQPTVTFEPSTPPLQTSLPLFASVDSPLKNPRKPPIPPALKIIPPTPAEELDRQLDPAPPGPPARTNSRPVRRLSLVQRARRYSDTFIAPLLARAPSSRGRTVSGGHAHAHEKRRVPSVNEDDGNLHPFWRPRGFWDGFEDSSDEESEDGDGGGSGSGGGRRLPQGGDTSEVREREREGEGVGRFMPLGLGMLGHRLTNGFKSPAGFLIGNSNSNSPGVERARSLSSHRRRHVVDVPALVVQAPTFPTRVEKRGSRGSLRSERSWERKGGRREAWRKGKVIPGLGVQVQYIGLSGVKEKLRERQVKKWERSAEKRRDIIRKSIGPRFLVEGARVV